MEAKGQADAAGIEIARTTRDGIETSNRINGYALRVRELEGALGATQAASAAAAHAALIEMQDLVARLDAKTIAIEHLTRENGDLRAANTAAAGAVEQLRVEIARLNGLLETIYRSKHLEAAHDRREGERTRMTRVLLVCPEPLGTGSRPASASVSSKSRASCVADGHSVTVLSPDAGGGARVVTPGSSIRSSPPARRHDVAVVQGHVANDFFAHARPIPTVVDLYDPFIVENLHYYAERGAEVFTHDHATLMQSLVHGDLFLCASEAQRLFYLGAAARGRARESGRVRERSASRVADRASRRSAFSRRARRLQTARPDVAGDALRRRSTTGTTRSLAIDAVAIARAVDPGADADVHPPPESATSRRRESSPRPSPTRSETGTRLRSLRAVGRRTNERAEFFERFALALLTFPQSIETDLSMRTRVYDYLWGGLPIVTSSAPGTDELLTRYAAGSVVAATRRSDSRTRSSRILHDRERYHAMREGARGSSHEHQWARTLAPLRRVLPRAAHRRRPRTHSRRVRQSPQRPRLDPRPPQTPDRRRALSTTRRRHHRQLEQPRARRWPASTRCSAQLADVAGADRSPSSTTARPTASIAAITARYPDVRFLPLGENRGFTGGLAAGAGAPRRRDNVVFLNNDAVPEPGWLAALVARDRRRAGRRASRSAARSSIDGKRIDFIGGVMTFDGHAFQNGFRYAARLARRAEPRATSSSSPAAAT